MPLQAITSTEPIPGYQIVERIGAGGYGEVWRANAPGGLVKAIKFVYGYLDEDRATRELKALNRIKEVRHPFLLSLERIEVVDGQLLIVTELADGSLKDRFDECLSEGAHGIDRQELLAYMRDASDVLDYMSEKYSLQHLDVKPENLLLVGGRIKVADFGLVKDIHDATASLMGGLTPLYAPPEVFDGRPSRWSDQYSLAIVYQEMLTGELPFPGKTAAQLARQHLNARPRLSALPDHDRPVIARALAKNPKERFANCHALVEHLFRSDSVTQVPVPETLASSVEARETEIVAKPTSQEGKPKRQTAVLQEVPVTRLSSSTFHVPLVPDAPALHALPPLDMLGAEPRLRPTLFLGIGGVAGRVLPRLISRLQDRHGDLGGIPAWQFMLLDSDAKDLMAAAHADATQVLQGDNLMCLPLRRPQDYKNDSRQILQWLSRRWLYNIPKSLKTEGLRPLGRLAFVDHAEPVMDRIAERIQRLADSQAVEASVAATGLPCESKHPRIVMITAISGGTGGGMFVDLAYGIRNLLVELNLPDDDALMGILLHGTGRSARGRELAIVNAYASLLELNHFSRPGSYYPGDPACRLPCKDGDDNQAFRHAYLVHLGDELTDLQLDGAVDKVAEYLYLDSATAAGSFFDRARQQSVRPKADGEEIQLHTFGVHQLSCFQDDVVSWACEQLCHCLAEFWVTGGITSPNKSVTRLTCPQEAATVITPLLSAQQLTELAQEQLVAHQLDSARLIGHVVALVDEEMGCPSEEFFSKELERLQGSNEVRNHADPATAWVHAVRQTLDRLLGAWQTEEGSRPEPGFLENSLASQRRKYVLSIGQALQNWLLELVDRDDVRVGGGQTIVETLKQAVDRMIQETTALEAKVGPQVQQTHGQIVMLLGPEGRKRAGRNWQAELVEAVRQFCRIRMYYFVLGGGLRIQQALRGQLAQIRDELHDLGRELKHLGRQFSVSEFLPQEDGRLSEITSAVTAVLAQQLPELVRQLNETVQRDVLGPHGGLVKLMTAGGQERYKLPDMMRTSARAVLAAVMKRMDVADLIFTAEDAEDRNVESLRESLSNAQPTLACCGGAKRLLVMLPDGSTDVRPLEILHRKFHEAPSVVPNCDGDFVMCVEMEQMSLTQAAVHLIDGRRDYAEFAHRLFTRNDVIWSPLPDLVGPGD